MSRTQDGKPQNTPGAASLRLTGSMNRLVWDLKMLTCLAVAYGTKDRHIAAHTGNVQEVERVEGAMVPCVRPVGANTLYDLASLTKMFTLIGVMQLVSRGQVKLSDFVGRIEPRFTGLTRTSVEQVLCYEATLETPERIDAQPDREAALRQVFGIRVRPEEAPRLYSDMNALVLKYVVERAAGMPFYEYVQKNILSPAGMAETFSRVPPERVVDCACYNYEHRILGDQYLMRADVPPGVPHDAKTQILRDGGRDLCGHAGLFSSLSDMVRLCQALLSEKLLPADVLIRLSVNRQAGADHPFLGYLCFVKGPEQRFSEVPPWMGSRAIAQSGFTGNHVAIDPELGVFDLFLGNRCHNRVSVIQPPAGVGIERYALTAEGAGLIPWPDGRKVQSSYLYVYQKDEKLHAPIREHMEELGWI